MLRFVTLLAAVSLPAIATAASAVQPIEVTDTQQPPVVQGTTSTCTFEPGPLSPVAYVYGSPLHFTSVAWRIPSGSACTACPAPHVLDLRTVDVRVRWQNQPCTAEVDLSVVGAKGDPLCLEPDTNVVLCAGETYILQSTGQNYESYTLDFDQGCCVLGEAFVLLRFRGLGDCVNPVNGFTSGLSATTTTCTNCQQFVTIDGLDPGFMDWCVTGEGSVNSVW